MSDVSELAVLMEGYRLFCLAEGKQPTTIRWYMGKLRVFDQYLVGNNVSTDMAGITTMHLRAFLVHLRQNVKSDENNPGKPARDAPLSPKTIQGYARTLKAFFTWAAREGYLPQNPSQRLRIPKAPRVLINTLSDRQIKSLFDGIDTKTDLGFRNYSLILTLLDTGIRLSELVYLQMDNLDLERGFFKVFGKGARERLVPFGSKTQMTLWKYIQKHRPEPAHPNQHSVFLRSDGRPLTSDLVYRMVRELGTKAGIEGVRCSPHTFRHTFAKNFLMNGGDLFTLQKILGHSSLSVVRMYVELTPQDVQVQYRQYSPMDTLKV